MAVDIVPAVDDDVPDLTALFGSHQDHYFRERTRRSDLGNLLVARLDEKPVGVVHIRFADAEEWELRDNFPRVPVLSHLQVLPEYRRRGVATEIMHGAEHFVRRRGRRRLILGVTLDNDVAYRMYLHLGYEPWDHRPINSFVERFTEDGTKDRDLEMCRILVKDLALDHQPSGAVPSLETLMTFPEPATQEPSAPHRHFAHAGAW